MSKQSTMSRRWRALSVVAVANLVAIGLVAAPSQAQAVSLCSGTAEGLTIAGDLAVPAGASCNLINVTVTGDVVVRADANLALDVSTVRGDLTIRGNGFASVVESTVRGTTVLRQAFGVAAEDARLAGVDARNSQFFFSEGTDHGEVFSAAGQTVVLSGWLDGDLRTNRDVLTDVDDTVITGGVNINQADNGTVFCRSEIDGDAVYRNNLAVVQLGDNAPVAGCEFNVFGGRVVLRGNAGEIRVSDNVIRGNLVCADNQPAPIGADNRLRGQGVDQCAELAPAGFGLARALTPSSIDARSAGVRAQIDARTATAASAAASAGPANL